MLPYAVLVSLSVNGENSVSDRSLTFGQHYSVSLKARIGHIRTSLANTLFDYWAHCMYVHTVCRYIHIEVYFLCIVYTVCIAWVTYCTSGSGQYSENLVHYSKLAVFYRMQLVM